ncbi:MAG: PIN domain-containing protein [Eubacteriales bacterium]
MTYLIDFENVGNSGFEGVEKLEANDRIIIFYSEKSQSLAMATHCRLEGSKATKEYICVKVGGKNALDFQLATYLGHLIATQGEESYVIVSKDQGYDFVCNFWKGRDKKITRCTNLNHEDYKDVENKLVEILTEDKDKVKKIADLIDNYKTKQGINNALVKTYGSEKAGQLYRCIRPLLADKKGK